MNTIPNDRVATSRILRGIGAAAVGTILIAGLSGCMTGRVAAVEPVQRNAVAPAGIDTSQPADRIAEQLAQQSVLNRAHRLRYAGQTADRIAEDLAREQPAAQPTPTANPYPGQTADNIERRLGGR